MVVIPFPEPPPVLTLEAMRGDPVAPSLRWRLPRHPDFELLNGAILQVLDFMEFLAMDPLHTGNVEGLGYHISEVTERLVELMAARIAEINRRVDEERVHDPITPRKFLYERFARLADDPKYSPPEPPIAEPQDVVFPRRDKPVSLLRLWNWLRYPRLTRIWGPIP